MAVGCELAAVIVLMVEGGREMDTEEKIKLEEERRDFWHRKKETSKKKYAEKIAQAKIQMHKIREKRADLSRKPEEIRQCDREIAALKWHIMQQEIERDHTIEDCETAIRDSNERLWHLNSELNALKTAERYSQMEAFGGTYAYESPMERCERQMESAKKKLRDVKAKAANSQLPHLHQHEVEEQQRVVDFYEKEHERQKTIADNDTVYVRPHTRNGRQIKGFRRKKPGRR